MPHPLNFEIQKYYKNEPRFNGVYSRDSLSKIKDGAYVINLDKHYDIGTHWVAFWVNSNNNVTYFGSFGVEHIPKEIKAFINNNNNNNNDKNNNNIKTNIFSIQAHDSIRCEYFCIEFMVKS